MESFLCCHFAPQKWSLATLSTKLGGLGLRSAARHSTAAFLSSRSTCTPLCQKLDPNYATDVDVPDSDVYLAMQDHNNKTPTADALDTEAFHKRPRQQQLSTALDSATRSLLKEDCQAQNDPLRAAHLELTSVNGSSQWLHVLPSKHDRKNIEPLRFKVMMQRLLRAPIFDAEFPCQFCDGTVDRFGDHCLVCSGGGDRTRRHHLLRNELFFNCCSAGLGCELEKPGLLCPRPYVGALPEDGVPPATPDDPTGNARRPADVYVARWRNGIPAAFDLAVTSALRHDVLARSTSDPSYACREYEDFKRADNATDAQCRSDGGGDSVQRHAK